jgi:hypothetical protein
MNMTRIISLKTKYFHLKKMNILCNSKTNLKMNNIIKEKIKERSLMLKTNVINKLQSEFSHLNISSDTIYEIYKQSVSIRQSQVSRNGAFLENTICEQLNRDNISFKTQVTIDQTGVIIGFNFKKKCHHIIDIVIGNDICEGKHITDFIVLSCKTTCRERWTQDNWSFIHKPKLYLLLTINNDYPSSKRFQEDDARKIITTKPKIKDDRLSKYSYDDLIDEIKKHVD